MGRYLRDKTTGFVSGEVEDERSYNRLVALGNYEDVGSQDIAGASGRFLATTVDASAVAVDNVELLSDGLDYDVTVTSVTYTPATVLTGADTNSRTISVQAGPDKASPISVASKAFTAGVNAPAGAATAITLGTAAVPAGETIVAKSVHVGTGLADPGGLLVVNYTVA